MADYDSDSSGEDIGEDVLTNVLLGYSSAEAVDNASGQLGGHPTWSDEKYQPNGQLAKCKVCNSLMSLLLQLRAPLDSRDYDRSLYVWSCRRKACRRKEGSVRAFRAARKSEESKKSSVNNKPIEKKSEPAPVSPPAVNLGATLFGVKSSSSSGQTNPFSSPQSNGSSAPNPFGSASSLTAKAPQKGNSPSQEASSLPETFAQKARLSSTEASNAQSADKSALGPPEPWPQQSAFPKPYPSYYVETDAEYITRSGGEPVSGAQVVDVDGNTGSSSSAEDKAAFESTMDRTFQRFADRLAENPEQVLRYEWAGQPLLYAKSDAVGKLLAPIDDGNKGRVQVQTSSASSRFGSKVPRCGSCGARREFELQLTPYAIMELESDDMSLDGMDWGTIIVGSCSDDCAEAGKKKGEVSYTEEWVGVQWEELATR